MQRSEQNGRQRLDSVQGTGAAQAGHLTTVTTAETRQNAQRLSSKPMSRSTARGFRSRSAAPKRIHNMYLLALISGIAASLAATRT